MMVPNPPHDLVAGKNSRFNVGMIFVDGLPGCGKTMLNTIISTLSDVESLSYCYQIEQICKLSWLRKLSPDASTHLIELILDEAIYNQFLGRNVNTRPNDLSSIYRYNDPEKYLIRIREASEDEVCSEIDSRKPILNFAIHNNLPFSKPLFSALPDRALYIHLDRHPVLMLEQQARNFSRHVSTAKDFEAYIADNSGNRFPIIALDWVDVFNHGTSYDKAVNFSYYYREYLRNISFPSFVYFEKFETFLKEPMRLLNRISDAIGARPTDATISELVKQRVPREFLGECIDLEVYRRNGWCPSDFQSNAEYIEAERDRVNLLLSSDSRNKLDQMILEY